MRVLLTSLVVSLGAPALGQAVEQLWETRCVSCHGAGASGASAEALSGVSDWLGGRDRELFDAVRSHGIDGSTLPALTDGTAGSDLTAAEAWALVNHIREFQETARKAREPAPRPARQGVFESEHHRYRLEKLITDGLDLPWSVDWLPDGRVLVAERAGGLRIWEDGSLGEPIRSTPAVRHVGQGGLMDIAPHPDWAENGWVYLSYAHARGDEGMTRIVRGRLNGNRWTDEELVWEADADDYLGGGLHFGCRLVFDGAGHLFFPIGERGRGSHAQDLTRPNGKVHRVRDDGSIPSDNPFADEGGGVYASIWSYGHRNPQGLAMDQNGVLWDTEHGPRGGDEVNIVERGVNYGWPIISFGMNYNGRALEAPWAGVVGADESLRMPAFRWLPSIAACGLDIGRGGMFRDWEGDLLAGGLAGQVVERLRFEDGILTEREELLRGIGRVRDVAVAPDGAVWVILNGPDQVVRLIAVE